MTGVVESKLDLIAAQVANLEEYQRTAPLTGLVWAYVQALDHEGPRISHEQLLENALDFARALLRKRDELQIRARRRTLLLAASVAADEHSKVSAADVRGNYRAAV
jgi:hypothetical protein